MKKFPTELEHRPLLSIQDLFFQPMTVMVGLPRSCLTEVKEKATSLGFQCVDDSLIAFPIEPNVKGLVEICFRGNQKILIITNNILVVFMLNNLIQMFDLPETTSSEDQKRGEILNELYPSFCRIDPSKIVAYTCKEPGWFVNISGAVEGFGPGYIHDGILGDVSSTLNDHLNWIEMQKQRRIRPIPPEVLQQLDQEGRENVRQVEKMIATRTQPWRS